MSLLCLSSNNNDEVEDGAYRENEVYLTIEDGEIVHLCDGHSETYWRKQNWLGFNMIEIGLNEKEAGLVITALNKEANSLEDSHRYRSSSDEDNLKAQILRNIAQRIRLQG